MDRREDANNLNWWVSLEGLDIPLLLVDNENGITRVTQAACEALGYAKSELKRRTLVQITHPDDRNDETNTFIDVFYGGKKSGDVNKRFITPQQQTVHLRQRIFPLHENGSIAHALVYLTHPAQQASASETIQQLKHTLELFDTGEFDGAYNVSVIQRARQLLAQLEQKESVIDN